MYVFVNELIFLLSCQQYPGKTLLVYAAEKGQTAIVDRLLLAGANIESKDKVKDSLRWVGLWSSVDLFALSIRPYLKQLFSCHFMNTTVHELI
jgi:hypothetical protein